MLSVYQKIMGAFRVTFLATELRVIGHAHALSQITLAMSRGNNRVIPFVGVARVATQQAKYKSTVQPGKYFAKHIQ